MKDEKRKTNHARQERKDKNIIDKIEQAKKGRQYMNDNKKGQEHKDNNGKTRNELQ